MRILFPMLPGRVPCFHRLGYLFMPLFKPAIFFCLFKIVLLESVVGESADL